MNHAWIPISGFHYMFKLNFWSIDFHNVIHAKYRVVEMYQSPISEKHVFKIWPCIASNDSCYFVFQQWMSEKSIFKMWFMHKYQYEFLQLVETKFQNNRLSTYDSCIHTHVIYLKNAKLSFRKGNFENMVLSYTWTSCLQSVSKLNVSKFLIPASKWFSHAYQHTVSEVRQDYISANSEYESCINTHIIIKVWQT